MPEPDADVARQREVVDAFAAAAREGDFDALVAVLHPDVVLRADFGPRRRPVVLRGAAAVARQARAYREVAMGADVRPALINGAAGGVVLVRGQPFSVMSFTVRDGRIAEIDVLQDPERMRRLAAAVLDDSRA